MDDEAVDEQQGSSFRRFVVVAFLVACALAVLLVFLPGPREDGPRQTELRSVSSSRYENARVGVAYVGDEACARCHAEIARTYREHPMGRSMTLAANSQPGANGVVFQARDLIYSVLVRDGRVFHREEKQVSKDSKPAVDEREVKYILGSGTRGKSFLVERGDRLYQSPIGWYAQEPHWNLSPRYEIQNLHFDRPITKGCLYCHANQVEMKPGQPVVFNGLAIGCERCHGPGELHVRQAHSGRGKDLTIVNPADLEPPALRESVCEQCHLQGFARTDRPGRTVFDFRPGLALDDFVTVSYGRGDPAAAMRAVGHVEQMRKSVCYERSSGKLGCISCHDPHRRPAPEERASFYREKCLQCHADKPCATPAVERIKKKGDDCAACHMPKSQTTVDVAHTSITIHLIERGE